MGKLEGRVAVVTGSSMGIGRAIAERFAREGASVVINSRDAGRAQGVAAELHAMGFSAVGVGADVSVPEQANQLAAAAFNHFGGLDIWVNNAGINAIGPSAELDPDDFARVIAVNLNGVFYGSQAAGKVMVQQRRGVIVQIGSIYGEVGMVMRAAYCSAKHGVMGLTKVLASEWAPYGVRVVCINPGYIQTALDVADQQAGGYDDSDIIRRTPVGRYGTVEEVAAAAVFVVSDEASFITGTSVTVDGGWVGYGGW
ncbi:MAG: glucose 1-dehydrogenase [Alicyclobacillus macrosporangiidus]|uniref:SDR family NAD(P)-dependent oxidoreductase n=1 Tax=Alicyclobacillus macrosporangiidus TaxID=392015 RepID=UPI0026EF5FD3|nr:glucose 1-dehydrogenase [Alicyclobacillus macrosporangiidus]MCL6598788.1 glucose 1-dehydrogenase [Alicyclobacillus macrosporangiidus]